LEWTEKGNHFVRIKALQFENVCANTNDSGQSPFMVEKALQKYYIFKPLKLQSVSVKALIYFLVK